MPSTKPADVIDAERKVSAVLEDLEDETDSEVKRIALEDVVATDPDTGRPAVQKSVDITTTPKPDRKWAR